MNKIEARQSEGHDFLDYATVAFNAVGFAEVAYVAGTNARAALPGLGALSAAVWPIDETYPAALPFFPGLACPHDAQETRVYATQACVVRWVNRTMIQRWIAALAVGAPFSLWPIPVVQEFIPANTWFTVKDKWAVLYVVGTGVAGNLLIKASG